MADLPTLHSIYCKQHEVYISCTERRKNDAKKNLEGRERSSADYYDLALLLGESRDLVQSPTPILSGDNVGGIHVHETVSCFFFPLYILFLYIILI